MNKESICRLRDVQRAISALEQSIERMYGLNINEAMLLCTLRQLSDEAPQGEPLSITAGRIAELLGLTCSNASKVIASVERKGLVERSPGIADKREKLFVLTPQGTARLAEMNCDEVPMPDILVKILEG